MSKLVQLELRISNEYKRSDIAEVVRAICRQVDGVTEGSISSYHNAASAAPTSSVVPYAQGDFIWNVAPSVMGTVGAQFTIAGWRCVVNGSPGTWVEMRFLTGT